MEEISQGESQGITYSNFALLPPSDLETRRPTQVEARGHGSPVCLVHAGQPYRKENRVEKSGEYIWKGKWKTSGTTSHFYTFKNRVETDFGWMWHHINTFSVSRLYGGGSGDSRYCELKSKCLGDCFFVSLPRTWPDLCTKGVSYYVRFHLGRYFLGALNLRINWHLWPHV